MSLFSIPLSTVGFKITSVLMCPLLVPVLWRESICSDNPLQAQQIPG